MTRIVFHLPERKRKKKQIAMAKMWAVAKTQAHMRSAPCATMTYVGITMIGQARQNVSIDTNQVSPAPRRANANVKLIESATEKIATQTSRFGTSAATSAKLARLFSSPIFRGGIDRSGPDDEPRAIEHARVALDGEIAYGVHHANWPGQLTGLA